MEELQARLLALEAENSLLRSNSAQPKTDVSPPQPEPSVCRVAIKLPPFWPDRVHVWFAQAEAQFLLAGITTDDTKYSHVLSQMDHRIAGEIEDIVINPPAEDKYKKLKDTLISRLSASEEQRVKRLLSDEELGDRKPSQFLRHLRSLAGTTLSDENILRQLWLRRLPQYVQGILAAQGDLNLERIADIADKIIEAQPCPANAYAVSSSPPINTMMLQIEELNKQVAALTSALSDRSRPRTRPNSRARSTSLRKSPKSILCWYHGRFGKNARRCISPCNFKAENTENNQ
jgi:hypothetical protein